VKTLRHDTSKLFLMKQKNCLVTSKTPALKASAPCQTHFFAHPKFSFVDYKAYNTNPKLVAKVITYQFNSFIYYAQHYLVHAHTSVSTYYETPL
jgi:hypothetical protein